MAFFMTSYGLHKIEKAFVGKTKEDVVKQARQAINQFPEYRELSAAELVDFMVYDRCEFDMVRVDAEWPGYDAALSTLSALYENQKITCSVQYWERNYGVSDQE